MPAMNEDKALQGLKVLDFSRVIAGPLLTQNLAIHGATVVKVESVKALDTLRVSAPYKDNVIGINRSAYFTWYNADKYSLSLDLRYPKAQMLVRRLVLWCDVIVENFGPETSEKFGLTYEKLSAIKPNLIMLSSSNQGQTGPAAHSTGYGFTLAALSGFTGLTGWGDREPCQPFGAITDFVAPYLGGTALLGALEYRRRTGKGLHLDISQYESAVYLLSPVMLGYTANGHEFQRMGNRSDYAVPHGAFPCLGKDRWCVIASETEAEWQALCKAMGKPELAQDPRFSSFENRKRNEDELEKILSEWTKSTTAEEVVTVLQGAGIRAGVVQNPAELFEDPQLEHRGHYQVLEHPEIGKHHYEMPAYRLSLTPGKLSQAAPLLGQDTEYVCKKFLGMSDSEFVELLNTGVFE